jgi:hypothetical protein
MTTRNFWLAAQFVIAFVPASVAVAQRTATEPTAAGRIFEAVGLKPGLTIVLSSSFTDKRAFIVVAARPRGGGQRESTSDAGR